MGYHEVLKDKIHRYIKEVYRITKIFPREELYGITSQLRRSSMSIMLNYVEGFARRKGSDSKVYKNFLEISYGSLKESEYLLYFSFSEGYIDNQDEYKLILENADKIGGMIWSIIKKME